MRRTLLAGLLLALAGCTTGPTRPPAEHPEQAWRSHARSLARLDAWRLTGRIAVVSGSEAWHANADGRQDHQSYDIRLIGPLGQGSVQHQGGERAVTLRDSDGRTLAATRADNIPRRPVRPGMATRLAATRPTTSPSCAGRLSRLSAIAATARKGTAASQRRSGRHAARIAGHTSTTSTTRGLLNRWV